MKFEPRFWMRVVLALFYFAAGFLHLASPAGFVKIVPSFVPSPETIVWFTGLCEIAGSIGLLIPSLRRAAGIGLALYAICVFPANFNHAINQIDVGALPNSWWYHGPRLVLQPVLVWWALFCAEVTNWPKRLQ